MRSLKGLQRDWALTRQAMLRHLYQSGFHTNDIARLCKMTKHGVRLVMVHEKPQRAHATRTTERRRVFNDRGEEVTS